MGVEVDVYVVRCHQIVCHSRIGKVNYGFPHKGLSLGDMKSTITFPENPTPDDVARGEYHPAAFSQQAFKPDENETGYKQYSFNPYDAMDNYGGRPIITTVVDAVSHFDKMIEAQPLWKEHKGFMRTKKILELFLDPMYNWELNEEDNEEDNEDHEDNEDNEEDEEDNEDNEEEGDKDPILEAWAAQAASRDKHTVMFWWY